MGLLEEAFYGAAFDESKHPRAPAGTDTGGQFTSRGGTGAKVQPQVDLVNHGMRGGHVKLPGVYLRFGDLPTGPDGNPIESMNNLTGEREKGTSVYTAWHDPRTGVYVVPGGSEQTVAGQGEIAGQQRVAYLVTGRDTGESGDDGEPLLEPGSVRVESEVPYSSIVSESDPWLTWDGGELEGEAVPEWPSEDGRPVRATGWDETWGFVAAGWDESEHPRWGKGVSEGGKFRAKEGPVGSSFDLPEEHNAKMPRISVKVGQAKNLRGEMLGLAPIDPSDPEFDEWMVEAVQTDPGAVWEDQSLTAVAWDPAKHPRHEAGTEAGGEFSSTATAEVIDPNVELLRGLEDEVNEWNPSRGTGQEAAARARGMTSKEYLQDKRAWEYAQAALRGDSRYGLSGQDELMQQTRILLVRKDGELIGVGDMSWNEDEGPVAGGSFGAVKGGGLPLFDAFLNQAVELGKGAVWTSGNDRSAALYDRLGIPLEEDYGYYTLTPEQVKLLADDMFVLARSRTAALEALIAAGWDESEHPRDPGGEAGGEFIAKGTGAEGAVKIGDVWVGMGRPEVQESLRDQNKVPELVEQQMEADLKDFLDTADLQMRVPEKAMLEILDDGEFFNQHQHEDGARGMLRTPEYEARMFGLPEDTDIAGLPKYGYLGPDHSGVISYGPVKVIFKDSVKDRTTFTINDSLMQGDAVVPSLVRDPSYLSANLSQIEEAVASAWLDELDPRSGEMAINLRYGGDVFEPDGGIWSSAIGEERTSIPYAEAQIYGKLSLDDIERVEVPPEEDWALEDPLTGLPQIDDTAALTELIDRLEEKGIKIGTYDVPGDYSGEWA